MGVIYGNLAGARSCCSAMSEADMNRRRAGDSEIGDRKDKAQPAGVLVLHAAGTVRGKRPSECANATVEVPYLD